MTAPSAAALIGAWDLASGAPPHARVAALLAAIEGAETISGDTLGGRNRRLLMLHRALVRALVVGPLEARVTCAHCAAESEFTLPADAILALPTPDPDARVRVRSGCRTLSFRLPRMTDIEAASHASVNGDVRHAVLERCRIGGDGAIPEETAERLGRKFEALDPAANIIVNIACSGCAQPIAASVDLAAFVARDLDRLVDGLFRDIDLIASAYGWSEQAILALAPERRRRYAAMIAAARTPARPSLVGRRA
jgi:hypothetical protein